VHAPQPDHSWNPHALTVASVGAGAERGTVHSDRGAGALAAMQGMNSSSIGIVFGTAAAAASVGNPKLKVPPMVR